MSYDDQQEIVYDIDLEALHLSEYSASFRVKTLMLDSQQGTYIAFLDNDPARRAYSSSSREEAIGKLLISLGQQREGQ